MSHPCSSRPRASHTSNVTASDRRVISARLRHVGILISELPREQRDEVRRWAATLTEVEIEMLAVTVRSFKSEDAFAGHIDRDVDVYDHHECEDE
jgi:hypothetical protein